MKKTIIIFAILLIPVLTLHAGVRIGAKAGVKFANATFNPSYIKADSYTGFQVGPIIEISGLTGLGLDASVLYSKHELKFWDVPIENKVSTLDIPVNLKMKFSLINIACCYLTAGPYVSFKVDEQTSFEQIKIDFIERNFGVGLNFGAGFELFRHLQIGVNYQLALNDDYSSNTSIMDNLGQISLSDFKAKTRIWSITATYFF